MGQSSKDAREKGKSPTERSAEKEKEMMERPIQQNAGNRSGVPEKEKSREEKNTARLEEEVEKMEEDQGV